MGETDVENKIKSEDERFDQWVQSEIWFMRGVGIVSLLIAAVSAISGMFATDDMTVQIAITALNTVMPLLILGAGAWALWLSFREERMVELVDSFMNQAPMRAFVIGGMQFIIGLAFILSGLNGSPALLLLGIGLLVVGGWFCYRGVRIRTFQSTG